jgi:hypothetical protein
MFDTGIITFREFVLQEELPLATLQKAVLEFLRGRDDAVVFGAQAVNAYVEESRMTQDIDLLSIRAGELAQELQEYLKKQFHIAIRVRQIGEGQGYRLYQVRKSGSRHLVDLRPVDAMPPTRRIGEILVLAPAELIARKVIAYHQRRGKPKSGTDWRDLAMLLLAFPELKTFPGAVGERLKALGVTPVILQVWEELVKQEILPADDEEEFE